MKSQFVRLVDVFILGPGMLYSAALIPEKHRYARGFLALTGAATIAYNWRNWQEKNAEIQDKKRPS
tara:strand:+ start:462 stop:659 length:198 start_codon:yes stop_codon:yes gene_type:complete